MPGIGYPLTVLRRHASTVRPRVVLWRDMRRIPVLATPLAPTQGQWDEALDALRPVYDRYVADVSPAAYAASLEASALLYHVCHAMEATCVLDLGSGFTSYVVRRYAREASYGVQVLSVDTDPDWLERTAAFLREEGCSTDGLADWAEFQASEVTSAHDLVFNDLHGDLREEATPVAIAHMASTGVLMVDDTNRLNLRRRVLVEGRAALGSASTTSGPGRQMRSAAGLFSVFAEASRLSRPVSLAAAAPVLPQ